MSLFVWVKFLTFRHSCVTILESMHHCLLYSEQSNHVTMYIFMFVSNLQDIIILTHSILGHCYSRRNRFWEDYTDTAVSSRSWLHQAGKGIDFVPNVFVVNGWRWVYLTELFVMWICLMM